MPCRNWFIKTSWALAPGGVFIFTTGFRGQGPGSGGIVPGKVFRVGVVGASSLAGKELADVLGESSLAADLVLLDQEEVAGQMTVAGDEPAFIQKLGPESFPGMDFVFFTGAPEMTRRYWKSARKAGASIVDMTYALEGEAGVLVRGPWAAVDASGGDVDLGGLDLTTPAVVAAHPAAVMLALGAGRVDAALGLRTLAATVFEPASEHGQAAMDELHQQTVSLLSFQTVPRDQFDAQVAFNLVPGLGDAAKVKLEAVRDRIARHYALLVGGRLPGLALQVVQAPVFHGYVISVLVELKEPSSAGQVEAALFGEHVDVVTGESDAPSNLSAAGQGDVLVRVTEADETRLWVWMAADNLKLAALNAAECANELRRLRPLGPVQ
jgi:aspartate-semialdehyde dehydrogenase